MLTKKVLKHGFVEEMEDIIDKAKKISHDAIAEKVINRCDPVIGLIFS